MGRLEGHAIHSADLEIAARGTQQLLHRLIILLGTAACKHINQIQFNVLGVRLYFAPYPDWVQITATTMRSMPDA